MLSDVQEVAVPDVTGVPWRPPPLLCGLAASQASRPIYFLFLVSLQKGPVAPAVAVTAPQPTPVVSTPQALPAQAASQPPQTMGIAVSQVLSLHNHKIKPTFQFLNQGKNMLFLDLLSHFCVPPV